MHTPTFIGIVPAAGIGARMAATMPKQYLSIDGKSILEHSVHALLSDQRIERVVIALHPEDRHFAQLALAQDDRVDAVVGGADRAHSVLNATRHALQQYPSAHLVGVVHDAARPCLSTADLNRLLDSYPITGKGGVMLASPVRDTMKRADAQQAVLTTVSRSGLWHAQTPQVFAAQALVAAIETGIAEDLEITDECSAMEHVGVPCQLVAATASNIKVTQPEDLDYASWLLQQR